MIFRRDCWPTALRCGFERARQTSVAMLVSLPVLVALMATGSAASCTSEGLAQSKLDPHKQELVAYGCSGAYVHDIERATSDALEFVTKRANEVTRPAIVLDIDETVLSNWRQMLANDFVYIPKGPCLIDRGGPCSARAWDLRAEAEPIRPMLALFNAAKARGVRVFFITGRRDDPALRAATARNLHRAGYYGWADLVMRTPDEYGLSAFEFKSRRRAGIAAQGYTITASIGDQWSDLDGGYAERTFKLPNPFYFIP